MKAWSFFCLEFYLHKNESLNPSNISTNILKNNITTSAKNDCNKIQSRKSISNITNSQQQESIKLLPSRQDQCIDSSRKELNILSDKMTDYLNQSVLNMKSEETNKVVDQLASFIEELKDYIEDILIDTTSQLEISNNHIYELFKSLNYLIKEVSALKIQNEDLKKYLLIINKQLMFNSSQQKSDYTFMENISPSLENNAEKIAVSIASMTKDYLLVKRSLI